MRNRKVALAMAGAALGSLIFPAAASAATPAAPAAPAAVSTTCPDTAHHQDAKHDGYNCSTIAQTPAQLWSVTLNGDVSYPVIAGGRVFVTTSNPDGAYGGDLYALDARTGKTLWGPIPLSGTYYTFTLAFDSGRVFVNDFDGTVRAFNATTGAQEWSTTTEYFSGEPVAANGTVWVDGSPGVTGLSESTGAVVAQSGYLDGDEADPAVSSTGVYLSTGCNTQYKLSLTATVDWEDNNGCSGGGGASAALTGSLMYGSEGDEILAQQTGAVKGSFAGTPAFSGTTGYFASGDVVAATSTKTSQPLWSATLPGSVVDGPSVTPSAVWVATDTPQGTSALIALDPSNGTILSSTALPGEAGTTGSGAASDLGVGNNLVVVPTGSTVSAFG
jgi:outer membrane protein assembly factor BamB